MQPGAEAAHQQAQPVGVLVAGHLAAGKLVLVQGRFDPLRREPLDGHPFQGGQHQLLDGVDLLRLGPLQADGEDRVAA